MKRRRALWIVTLVAKRAAEWAFSIVTGDDGDVADESMGRFRRDIENALAILDDSERLSLEESDAERIVG